MASPYSDDLRRKFFAAYQRGDGSFAVLAVRFGVSPGWAEKLMRQLRQTGQIERPPGAKRGPASKFTPELREQLGHWIRKRSDLTLAELQLRLWEDHRIEVSLSRLWTVLQEMGMRLKKSRSMPPSKTPKAPRSSVSVGANKRARSIRRS